MLCLLQSSGRVDHDLQAIQSKAKVRLQFIFIHGRCPLEMGFGYQEILLAVADDAFAHLEVILEAQLEIPRNA